MEEQQGQNTLVDKAKNEAKNQAKKAKKALVKKGTMLATKAFLPILPWVLVVIIAIMLAGVVLNIFSSVGEAIANGWTDFMTSITTPSGSIELSDEKVAEFIEKIEKETNVSFNSLKLAGEIDYSDPNREEAIREANIKYVRKFLEAQIATQELERPGVKGRVFAYRADQSNENAQDGTKLIYKTPEEYNALLENCKASKSDEIKNYFTLNEVGEMVVARIDTTMVDGNVTEKEYYTTPVNYKSLISQYTTTAQFFIYLGEIVQNPEFLAAVTDLIKEDTEIRITMVENTTTTTTTETNTYTLNTKQAQFDPVTGQIIEEHIDPVTGQTVGGVTTTSQNVTTTTTTTQISTNMTPAVNYVNTWQIEQTMTYEKETTEAPTQTITTGQGNVPAIPDEKDSGGLNSYKTNQVTTTTVDSKNENFELTNTSDYIYKAGEKPDEDPDYESFVDLLDKKFRIPNSKKEDAAGANFKSGAEWICSLLAQDPQTQNMEPFMRYILYKYTGKSYGVTDLDFSIFDVNYSNSYTGGVYGNTVQEKVWFSLKNMGYSDYAIAGAMGNIDYESAGFNVGAIEGGSGEGHGLCQWSFGRKDAIIKYAESKGKTWQDIDIQVQFLMGEITPGGGADGYATFQFMNVNGHNYDTWKNANSTADATTSFCYSFERPSNPSSSLAERIRRAEKYYNEFHGKELYSGATDSVKVGPYTFPHYLQRNYQGSYGDTTIAYGGCAPSSMAMVLAGLTNNPGITPVTVINNLNEYFGSWTNYYQAGVGTNVTAVLGNSAFLQKYYNVKATRYSSQEAIIANLKEGTAAIGSTPGHILAIVPVPDQYKNQGYRFYVLDSANGLSGAYRTVNEVRAKRNGSGFGFLWLIEPL